MLFAIWRQNSPNGYFAASAKIALILTQTLALTQTLTQMLTLIPTLTQTLTQTEEKHYFASRGKIAPCYWYSSSLLQYRYRYVNRDDFQDIETIFACHFRQV